MQTQKILACSYCKAGKIRYELRTQGKYLGEEKNVWHLYLDEQVPCIGYREATALDRHVAEEEMRKEIQEFDERLENHRYDAPTANGECGSN